MTQHLWLHLLPLSGKPKVLNFCAKTLRDICYRWPPKCFEAVPTMKDRAFSAMTAGILRDSLMVAAPRILENGPLVPR
jgi:hypothetical protein